MCNRPSLKKLFIVYIFMCRVTKRINLAIFVCINTHNSVTIGYRATKFGIKAAVYHMQTNFSSVIGCHFHCPRKEYKKSEKIYNLAKC